MATLSTNARSPEPRTFARTVANNSAANLVRLAVTSLVSIFLPAYLTHRLPVKTYGAWVLILQLSAYVGYLDFGVQTAVSKYIAEHEAKQDYAECARYASVGLAMMLAASILGVLLTLILAWRVPFLFHAMPQSLYHDVRLSVLFVGISLSASLASSVFVAIFLGLQRYQVPMVLTIVSRLLSGIAICIAVASHSSLARMGATVACVNLFSALLQFAAWRRLGAHIRVSLRLVDLITLKKMLRYCIVLMVFSVCMLFVSGLDVTIVGHYSFSETAYYAIAASPTSLILLIIGALIGPLLPATSALSAHRSSGQMGSILLRSTRYSTIMLLLTGLPLVVAGHPILSVWVGPAYAAHSVVFLRILVIANILRNVCAPYATMVVATGKQGVATAAAVTEGTVNLLTSIVLARHMGAFGVALGTLLGAVAGVAMHFAVSMRYTQSNLAIARLDLFNGMLRSSAIAVPSVLLLWRWWPVEGRSMTGYLYCGWLLSTLLLAWFVSMSREDRSFIAGVMSQKMSFS